MLARPRPDDDDPCSAAHARESRRVTRGRVLAKHGRPRLFSHTPLMSPEDPRPPVAIRITRPYTTEDEFLEQELESLSRTSVTLLGAQPRPQGVVLRFELVLSSGHVLMRGEGRVVGFRPNALQGLGGLTLRFTRLDSRSKALVDKANTLRERRRPSAGPAAPEVSPSA